MNIEKLYYYSIAKFVPDVLRNEPRNIGIIVFDDSSEFYRAKFVNNFRSKLGSNVLLFDRQLLNEYRNYFEKLHPKNSTEIKNHILNARGKFQFSEIKTVVSIDVNADIDYLYSTFVDDAGSAINHRHRFKTNIKHDLQSMNILREGKFEENKKVEVGDLEYNIDFGYQNGKLHAIEAIDLSVQDRRGNTMETAFKFDYLIRTLGPNNINAISVIQKTEEPDPKQRELIKILNAISTVYNYSNGQKEQFLKDIQKIAK
jgi:hypothetical protein